MVVAVFSVQLMGASRAVSPNPAAPPAPLTGCSIWLALALFILHCAVWLGVLIALDVPAMIGRTPWEVVQYLFLPDGAAEAQARFLAALAETLQITAAGMVAGIAVAFALAVTSHLAPGFTRIFLPVALVTQTMPLVALTPLLVLILGRGTAVTMWITVSVTFFPAYVMIAQGLAQVPRAGLELPRAYGATAWKEVRLVAIPASLPWLFAAIRTTVPRALLGVMIAEWLATGRGLGNL